MDDTERTLIDFDPHSKEYLAGAGLRPRRSTVVMTPF